MSEDKKQKVIYDSLQQKQDEYNDSVIKNSGDMNQDIMKNLIRHASGSAKKGRSIPRLAFAEDPNSYDNYAGIYKLKKGLIPDTLIKQIRIQSFLISGILRSRANTMSMMSHIRRNRFDVGVEVNIKPEFKDYIEPEQMVKINERIDRFMKIIMNCGHTDGLEEEDKMTLPEYIYTQTYNGLSFGRFATEIIYRADDQSEFHRFRPVDSGTIYRSVRQGEAAENVRRSSIKQLEYITGIKIDSDMMEQDRYAWVQVINGTPKQAFTSEEMVVYSLYPSSDVEHNGYPVTPLDTAMTSVTTHMSIEVYNKLYFQNGRAARGMLVINSDEIDQAVIEDIKQQFNASINNVQNSFRTPIFGVGKEDTVNWVSTQPQRKDGEFQFLFDQVTRNILSAFNMSPDELPGFTHLSRGTNQQSLCLDPSSKVHTPNGLVQLKDLLQENEEAKFTIWTGKDWQEARVFWTGLRDSVKTITNNGMQIITSPDHRFRVVGENGEPVWKHQHELSENDWVLINRKSINMYDETYTYKGKQLNEDMMELLGWLTGDGNISVRHNKNTGNIKQGVLSFFYHHEKEKDIWEKHAQIMSDFGLNVIQKEQVFSDEQLEKRKKSCFAQTASKVKITNILYDTDFVKFLLSLGFNSSTDGKTIPSNLYGLPEKLKCAFLRGFFSADGNVGSSALSPTITIHDNTLREQTKELLLSVGIRTQFSEGKFKLHPDRSRAPIKAQTKLAVKDKTLFFEKIGFLQEHKQPNPDIFTNSKRWEKFPQYTINKYTRMILEKDSNMLSKSEKDNLKMVISENHNRGISADKIKKYLQISGLEIPSWMNDFYCEKIVSIENLNKITEMVDVQVFDDEHAFVANGMVVHNSEANNEYKLIAARDTGIRPLIMRMQDFLNEKLFPIIDPELSQLCNFEFAGFDAETKQQESARLQQDMPLHYTYDDVMEEVDKDQVGPHMGGSVPFNEHYRQVLDQYIDVGQATSFFFDSPAATVDPILRFKRDQFWFQYMGLLQQANPAAFSAYFSTRPDSLKILKLYIQDYLDEDDLN